MLMCAPQIHTPDSSRYWLAGSYEARHAAGQVLGGWASWV